MPSEAGLWCAMVTQQLSPKDPKSRSPKALEAVNSELKALRQRPVWGEKKVQEKEDAKRDHPDGHFATVFPLVGIKNFECADEREHVYKGRIVLGSHDIRTSSGEWAIFGDGGTTPATMTATHAALAVAMLLNLIVLQTDCLRAYVQAKLQGPPTFVSLPRAWW